jgi:hypothetical protein
MVLRHSLDCKNSFYITHVNIGFYILNTIADIDNTHPVKIE